MKYQQPICECGGTLDYEKEMTINQVHGINKNGKVSKRYFRHTWADNGLHYLKCDTCSKRYDVDYDDKTRIIRGDFAF